MLYSVRMKTTTDRKKSTQQNKQHHKSPVFIISVVALVIVAGIFALLVLRAHPLGDGKNVIYLGEQDYGSLLPLSSMEPGTEYYYGTDLSAESLTSFFRAVSHESNDGTYDNQYTLASGKRINVRFYEDKNDYYDSLPNWAKSTAKKNLFTIDSKDYPSLEKSAQ